VNANDSSGRRKSSESRRGPDPTASTSQALVLGAGGVSGIAWITGLLTGLADAGKDVTDVELIVGTSAGATVAAQLGSGLSLQELYAR
jgi:NTE family protein